MPELQMINGRQMTFLDEGAGEAVVLLHAFAIASPMWRKQLAALSARYRIIAPDLPGFGGSEPISPSSSPMDRIGDSVAVLLETLRIDRFVLGGCSMGGYAAMALARRYPKMVRGLVLTNTRASADSDDARKAREATAQALMKRGMIELEETLLPKLCGPSTSAELREELRALLRAQSPVGSAAASRGMAGRLESLGWLARFAAPVLVIHGSDDAIISRDESQAMATAAKSSTWVELADSAHLSPMDQPERWNEAVTSWLKTLPR